MLDTAKVSRFAEEVVRKRVPSAALRVNAESIVDSEGQDALRIMLVFDAKDLARISGDDALDLLVDIQKKLQAKGEHRFAIVEYATSQELEAEARGVNDNDQEG